LRESFTQYTYSGIWTHSFFILEWFLPRAVRRE